MYTTSYSLPYPFNEVAPQLLEVPDFGCISYLDYCDGKFAFERRVEGEIVIYDIEKNATEQFIFKQRGYTCCLKWSKSGKYIALSQSEQIQIFNAEEKRCIKCYDVEYGCFADFYDNDTKLLIGTWKKGYLVDLEGII